jgi:hypothetical protein
MVGGLVSGPLLLAHSDTHVVVVRQVLAYGPGVELDVEAHARGPEIRGAQTDLDAPAPPRFRVRFGDGEAVTQDDETNLRTGRGPVMVMTGCESSYGGPGAAADFRLTLWLTPLPRSGPITVTCVWPERGLEEADVVFDGDAVRTAAGRAFSVWG